MKYKEKEKLWLLNIKELCKSDDWKFKSYFIFKAINDLYFSANFYVSMKENSISGWLEYKPMNIDNVFWDIINEQSNKKMPLSFRGEAAFCVRGLNYFEYKIDIIDDINPKSDIKYLLKLINDNVSEKLNTVKTYADYRRDMLKDEDFNCVGIITSFIEQKEYNNALLKIKEYKKKDIESGFEVDDKDFFELAIEYCNKNYR